MTSLVQVFIIGFIAGVWTGWMLFSVEKEKKDEPKKRDARIIDVLRGE